MRSPTRCGRRVLSLPVEAGTKVLFAGNLGAYLSYDEIPTEGSVGEVVTVKSANGDITHHDGKVFVKWDDGKFLGVHAEHLRLAGTPKKASDLKKQFEKVKALAEKKPDNKFLKDLLEQMADEGFTPTDKQMKVVKDIEGEVKQQAEMKKVEGAEGQEGRPPSARSQSRVPPDPRNGGTLPVQGRHDPLLRPQGRRILRPQDGHVPLRQGFRLKSGVKPLPGQRKSAFAGGHIDAEILRQAHAAGRKARSMPMTYGNMDMAAASTPRAVRPPTPVGRRGGRLHQRMDGPQPPPSILPVPKGQRHRRPAGVPRQSVREDRRREADPQVHQ